MKISDDNEVSVKTLIFLTRKGIVYFDDFRKFSSDEIMKWSDMERKTLTEILYLMKKHNIAFEDNHRTL